MATFDGIALDTLTTWLSEAQTAYHALNTGTQVISLRQGDTSLTFTVTEVAALRRYISDLQAAIALYGAATRPRRGVYIGGGKGR